MFCHQTLSMSYSFKESNTASPVITLFINGIFIKMGNLLNSLVLMYLSYIVSNQVQTLGLAEALALCWPMSPAVEFGYKPVYFEIDCLQFFQRWRCPSRGLPI